MKFFILFLITSSLWAQDNIQTILERDPFDPNRGQVDEEEVEPEEEEEEVVLPDNMPVLDGTIIFGDVRIAMFSLEVNGQKLTARAEMRGASNDYVLYVRQPKSQRGESALSANSLGEPNGKLGEYTIAKIDTNQVELRKEAGRVVPLEMYLRDAKDRGGSKDAAAKDASGRRPPRPEPVVIRANDNEAEQPSVVDAKTDGKNRKPTFRRRLERGEMSEDAKEKKAQIKKKF